MVRGAAYRRFPRTIPLGKILLQNLLCSYPCQDLCYIQPPSETPRSPNLLFSFPHVSLWNSRWKLPPPLFRKYCWDPICPSEFQPVSCQFEPCPPSEIQCQNLWILLASYLESCPDDWTLGKPFDGERVFQTSFLKKNIYLPSQRKSCHCVVRAYARHKL